MAALSSTLRTSSGLAESSADSCGTGLGSMRSISSMLSSPPSMSSTGSPILTAVDQSCAKLGERGDAGLPCDPDEALRIEAPSCFVDALSLLLIDGALALPCGGTYICVLSTIDLRDDLRALGELVSLERADASLALRGDNGSMLGRLSFLTVFELCFDTVEGRGLVTAWRLSMLSREGFDGDEDGTDAPSLSLPDADFSERLALLPRTRDHLNEEGARRDDAVRSSAEPMKDWCEVSMGGRWNHSPGCPPAEVEGSRVSSHSLRARALPASISRTSPTLLDRVRVKGGLVAGIGGDSGGVMKVRRSMDGGLLVKVGGRAGAADAVLAAAGATSSLAAGASRGKAGATGGTSTSARDAVFCRERVVRLRAK